MVNIRDVAKIAGVSPGTVSRVLNSDPTISVNEKTREKIFKVCEEMNYSPRKYKSKKKGRTVGIISAISRNLETQDLYYKQLREKIALSLKSFDIAIDFMIFPPYTRASWNRIKMVDCVIVIGCISKEVHQEIYILNKNILIVDDYLCEDTYSSVSVNIYNEMWKMLDRVHELGHENIAFFTGASTRLDIQGNRFDDGIGERGAAYLDWLKEKKLAHFENMIINESWFAQSGWDATDKLIKTINPLPTAIIAGSDLIAMGVLKRLVEAGISVPEEISVSSFDDLEIASFMSPSLTTVKIDIDEMIYWVSQLCNKMIINQEYTPTRIVLSGKLIERESLKSLEPSK